MHPVECIQTKRHRVISRSGNVLGIATYCPPACSTLLASFSVVSGSIVDVSANNFPSTFPASILSYISMTDWSSPNEVKMISASCAAASAEPDCDILPWSEGEREAWSSSHREGVRLNTRRGFPFRGPRDARLYARPYRSWCRVVGLVLAEWSY